MVPPSERPDVQAVHGTVVQVQQVGATQLAQQGGVQAGPDTGLGPVPQPAPSRHTGSAHTLCGNVRQATPVRSTYMTPASAVRSGTRNRPGWRRRRSGAGGNSRATRSHRSSGLRSTRTPDTLPTKIAEHKTHSSTHSETIGDSPRPGQYRVQRPRAAERGGPPGLARNPVPPLVHRRRHRRHRPMRRFSAVRYRVRCPLRHDATATAIGNCV